ncbi:hypothetical protein BUALT_Bualt04G0054500 [Buddleja alternifolia]|uniref:Uncharacterized protein n=1 Tax=Buddleja alternifolia TaxID=168488 RepID=A0AAV6XMW4_9LAMI|nr:hypothetical protein BUALT_Bualt04G0054500 [Buddleja alternifolia]
MFLQFFVQSVVWISIRLIRKGQSDNPSTMGLDWCLFHVQVHNLPFSKRSREIACIVEDNTSISRHYPRGIDGIVVGVTPEVENVEMSSVKEVGGRSGGLDINNVVIRESGVHGSGKDDVADVAFSSNEEISESALVSVPLTLARGRGMRGGRGRGGRRERG